MRGSDEGLWLRLRALCCRAWRMAPFEFEEHCAAGRVAMEDVIELYILEASTPFIGANVRTFLFREEEKDRETKAETIMRLHSLIRLTKDPKKKAAIAERLKELQNGKSG